MVLDGRPCSESHHAGIAIVLSAQNVRGLSPLIFNYPITKLLNYPILKAHKGVSVEELQILKFLDPAFQGSGKGFDLLRCIAGGAEGITDLAGGELGQE